MGLELFLDPSFLASIPRFVTPILLAGLGGAVCERAGVFNIGLEGMFLAGAFAAVLGAFFAGSPWLGALMDHGRLTMNALPGRTKLYVVAERDAIPAHYVDVTRRAYDEQRRKDCGSISCSQRRSGA